MVIQKCEVCSTPFTWTQITKSLWLAYQPIECRSCGAKHTVNFSSRVTASFLMVLPVFVFTLFSIGADLPTFIVNMGIVIAAISVITPYVVKYHRTLNEPSKK